MDRKDKNRFADGIGYTGQDERLLVEASFSDLGENLDHTVGDSLKLLENLAAITLNTYRSKYLNNNIYTPKAKQYFRNQVTADELMTESLLRAVENAESCKEEEHNNLVVWKTDAL